MVRALLAARARVDVTNKNDCNVLHRAVRRGSSMEIISLLVEHGGPLISAAKDVFGTTLLEDAVFLGRVEVVRMLMETNGHIEVRSEGCVMFSGQTAFANFSVISLSILDHFCMGRENFHFVRLDLLVRFAGTKPARDCYFFENGGSGALASRPRC